MEDLVSVIIPCYNHEKYIIRCIESVLNESYKNIELIILDDGSKDTSVELVEQYLENNQSISKKVSIYTQENMGIVKTLNKLVTLAKGKYIAVLASDDELRNNGIEKRIKYLKENPDKKAVIGNAVVINNEDLILKEDAGHDLFHAKKKLLNKKKTLNTELILQWSVVGPCLLLEKSVYEIIGNYNEDYYVEDRDFYLRMIEKKILGYVDETVAAYRTHGLNMSLNVASNRVRIECAKINIAHSKKQSHFFERAFLKSYRVDLFLLNRKWMGVYWINKIIRFGVVFIYRTILSVFS